MKNPLPKASVTAWILLGFLVSYGLFFLKPVFFSDSGKMNFFSYISVAGAPGNDLRMTVDFSRAWLIENVSPWTGHGYSPIAQLLFAPLMYVDDSTAYLLMTAITIIAYIFAVLIFPTLMSNERRFSSVVGFMFATGLFSYGLHFELERGQFNVLALALCLGAAFLYHRTSRLKRLSFLLFSLAVQLKLWPAIFVFLFLSEKQSWQKNLLKFLMLGLFNLVLLFAAGIKPAISFLSAVAQMASSIGGYVANHSIKSFTLLAQHFAAISQHPTLFTRICEHPGMLQGIFTASYLVCFFLILSISWRRKMGGLNPYLLSVCTLGALIIPQSSFDYKLSLLPGPLAYFFNAASIHADGALKNAPRNLILFTLGICYGLTCFSYTNKFHIVLLNNFPTLFIMLLSLTAFTILSCNNKQKAQHFHENISEKYGHDTL